jgi:ubiquinone/menaquinone biosynthesis C-methylase UbiE
MFHVVLLAHFLRSMDRGFRGKTMGANSDRALAATFVQLNLRRPGQEGMWFDPGYLFRIQAQERMFLEALQARGFESLRGKKVLDIGCGSGYWMRRCREWGAEPEDIYGIDLLEDRVVGARKLCHPRMHIAYGNAANLAFREERFDLVVMFLVLSMMPDSTMRIRVADEATRVLKPGGVVLWYDFRYRPLRGGLDMIGMPRAEVARCFPGFELHLTSASALPPLTRRIAPYAWSLCTWLDNLKVLNTHNVGTLVKPGL